MHSAALVLAALLVSSGTGTQQTTAISKGLKLEALPIAYVLDTRGVETQGRLLNLDSAGVVLLVNGSERRFELTEVSRVSRRGDSLKNGAAIGAAVGVAMGLLNVAMADCGSAGCGGWRVGAPIMSGLIYSAIGVGIDALVQGRTMLYEASPRTSVVHFGRGASFGLRVSW